MDFSTRYQKLNAAQKQAVNTIDGPLLVVAGPGTGKTELLSMRTANILKQTDTLPENILCLTFTESGASAMRERLSQIIGKDAFKVAIHTFHSFGSEIINQNGEYFYHGAHFRPADDLSSYELLRGIFDELPYDNPLSGKLNGEYTYLADTLTVISELKKSGLTSDELIAVLNANDEALDVAERRLGEIFKTRISASTGALLADVAHEIASTQTPELPIGITPLVDVLSLELAHAFDAATSDNSTKPLTAWRNKWMEKDTDGVFIFKDRRRHAKLRAASYIYFQYLSRMQEAELYDFDDMILRVVHAMEVFPDLRFNLQEKHQYIMVDEFQDTNLAQMRILYNLTNNEASNGRPNVMAVGDDDQAIYSFQGADVSNILNFQNAYRDVGVITLTDNYRSTSSVLEAARSVITQGSERLESTLETVNKQLTAHRDGKGSEVALLEVPTIDDERQTLVRSIKARIDSGDTPESIAVLARRHHELVSLLPHFTAEGIPVNYERQDNVLESEPIVVLETLASIVVAIFESRHSDAEALLPELISHQAWGFSPEQIWRLSLAAHRQHSTWMEVMATTPDFVPFHTWLIGLAVQVPHVPLEYLLDRLLGNIDPQVSDDTTSEGFNGDPTNDEPTPQFISPLYNYFFSSAKLADNPDEYMVYLESLRTIRSKLRDYQPEDTPTLRTFLAFISLHRQLGSSITSVRPHIDAQVGAVNLMTAHKSKGLEFDSVYIIGAIDTAWGERVRSRSRLISYPENLPLAPSGDSLDERLRLFFVAMTRARCNLSISYSLAGDNDKATLGASFLLASNLEATQLAPVHTASERIAATERRWYESLVSLSQATMHDLLGSQLQTYKLSATHLNNFLDITRGGPETFLLNNLLRFPQAMSPNAAYGSAIHQTLQRAHAHLAATGTSRPIEDILHDFEENLKQQHLDPSDFTHYLQKGSDTLGTFLAAKYDTFSPSQKVELNFSGQQAMVGDARLTGALDLVDIDQTNRVITVTDYKTGKPSSSWSGKTDFEKIKLHKYRQQLMFYKLLVEQSRDYNSYIVGQGILQFVEPTPTGSVLSLDLSFDSDELEQFKKLIEAVWQCVITLDLPKIDTYEQSYKGMLAFEQALLEKN